MIALMFDLHFKFLQVLENYVGWGNVICLIIEYDAKAVIPLLMIIFDVLNPIVQTFATQVDGSYVEVIVFEKKDNNIFGVGAFVEESSCALVVGKLSIFKRLSIILVAFADPLSWWHIHETQFPNVGLLVEYILEITGSHIEIKHVFNLVGV
jgi:hypothetical protein